MKPDRPSPETLLRQIEAEELQAAQGRLKIFLGYAPRVGKSLRMFEEGRRRLDRGQDVVVGAMQTRGADDLAEILREFEVVPFLPGDTVDVETILQRKPQVCLMDELAHNNPPGRPRPHRWQDVQALLARGINVIAAINLQHVEEHQESVERITGKRARATVPESFLFSADELVIVDVPPDALPGSNSLDATQLSHLREAALLLAAQVVEHQLQRYMDAHGILQSWGTQERVLVCITAQPSARAMLESGARAAASFHGPLLVVHVRRGELSRPEEEMLADNLAFARTLGAEIHILEGADPIGQIIRFAREQRITQLFVGHTRQHPWKIWKTNPLDRMIRAAEGMDVRIFPAAQPL